MTTLSIAEAQTRLQELIQGLAPGEEVVITENSRPVAKLVGIAPLRRLRPGPGLCNGMIEFVSDDEEHLRAFVDYMP
jgi:prevent-host-death family protein